MQFIEVVPELLFVHQGRRALYKRGQKVVAVVAVVVAGGFIQLEETVVVLPDGRVAQFVDEGWDDLQNFALYA